MGRREKERESTHETAESGRMETRWRKSAWEREVKCSDLVSLIIHGLSQLKGNTSFNLRLYYFLLVYFSYCNFEFRL